jgi:hypothetical protein
MPFCIIASSWTSKVTFARLSSPLDLAVANSAPGYYSRYWAYSPCADHHKLLLVKSCFFAINWLISWTLKY